MGFHKEFKFPAWDSVGRIKPKQSFCCNQIWVEVTRNPKSFTREAIFSRSEWQTITGLGDWLFSNLKASAIHLRTELYFITFTSAPSIRITDGITGKSYFLGFFYNLIVICWRSVVQCCCCWYHRHFSSLICILSVLSVTLTNISGLKLQHLMPVYAPYHSKKGPFVV